MSSDHNDLSAWAGRARLNGQSTIEIDVDLADRVVDEIVRLSSYVGDLQRHLENMDKIVKDKLGETQLLRAGPGDEGFEIELAGGPIGILAEYLVQMMHMDPKKPLNYFEVEVHPKGRHDPMVINIQRTVGKTPAQLHGEARKRIEELESELGWRQAFIRDYDLGGDYDDYLAHYEADGGPPDPNED